MQAPPATVFVLKVSSGQIEWPREVKLRSEESQYCEGYELGRSWAAEAEADELVRLEQLRKDYAAGWQDFFSDDGEAFWSPLQYFAFAIVLDDGEFGRCQPL